MTISTLRYLQDVTPSVSVCDERYLGFQYCCGIGEPDTFCGLHTVGAKRRSLIVDEYVDCVGWPDCCDAQSTALRVLCKKRLQRGHVPDMGHVTISALPRYPCYDDILQGVTAAAHVPAVFSQAATSPWTVTQLLIFLLLLLLSMLLLLRLVQAAVTPILQCMACCVCCCGPDALGTTSLLTYTRSAPCRSDEGNPSAGILEVKGWPTASFLNSWTAIEVSSCHYHQLSSMTAATGAVDVTPVTAMATLSAGLPS